MATGYNTDGSEAPLYDLGWAAPAGQMYSTVNDLMKVRWFSLCDYGCCHFLVACLKFYALILKCLMLDSAIIKNALTL